MLGEVGGGFIRGRPGRGVGILGKGGFAGGVLRDVVSWYRARWLG